MARPTTPRTLRHRTDYWHGFFEAILAVCPSVLDSLRESALASFKSLPQKERTSLLFGPPSKKSAFHNCTLGDWQRRFLDPWAKTFHLLPYKARAYPIVFEILQTLDSDPNHPNKGLWWLDGPFKLAGAIRECDQDAKAIKEISERVEHLNRAAATPAGIRVRVYLPPVDFTVDKTFRGYCKRVKQDPGLSGALLRGARNAWKTARREDRRRNTDPGYVRIPRRDKRSEEERLEAAALAIIYKMSLRVIAERHKQRHGTTVHHSEISRWIKEVKQLLQ